MKYMDVMAMWSCWMPQRYLMLWFLFVPIDLVHAQAPSSDSTWWLTTHREVSQTVGKWSNGLDAFFSGKTSDDINQSYVSLRLGSVLSDSDGNIQASPFLGLSTGLRLPNTEDRLRLVIESDADQLTSTNKIQESTADNLQQAALSETFSAAIRYVKKEWNANVDAGILVDFPLDPFIRARLAQEQILGDWRLGQTQSFFSYYSQGFGVSLTANAMRALNDTYDIGATTSVTWLKRDKQYYWREDVFLNQAVDDKQRLRYQLSFLQSGATDPILDTYLYYIQYQRVLYQNWLIGQVTPQITHRREQDFNAEISVTLALEVLLGEEYLGRTIAN